MGIIEGGNIIESLRYAGYLLAPDARAFLVDPGNDADEIETALESCTSGQGDFIVCLPGSHGADGGSITLDCEGVTIVAADYGHPPMAKGESFTLRTAASLATVPGVTVKQPCRIIGMGITGRDITKESLLIDCEEQGWFYGGYNYFKNCRFSAWYGAMDVLVRIIGGNVNYFEKCTFDGLFGGITTAGIQIENDAGGFAPDYLRIIGCEFSAMGSSKPALKCKTGAVPLDVLVAHNYLLPGFNGNQGVMIDFNSVAVTGMACDNWLAPLANQAAAFLNTGGLSAFGFADNHYEE